MNPFSFLTDMNKIGICYMATSVYKEYFNYFLYTAINLFPNDKKILFVISDGLSEFNGKSYQNIDIIVNNIVDLPYPIITACKLRYLTEFTKNYDLDYILYFDADTIIFKKPDYFWEWFKSKMNTNKLIMSKHPHYLYTPDRDFGEPFLISNDKSIGYVDNNLVNERKSYIITSFFAGTPQVIKETDDKIYNMLGSDLSNFRWMPLYPDEAYLNAIYVNENILNDLQNIDIDRYITINPYLFIETDRRTDNIWENNFPEFSTIFINQKYNAALKNKKKNNDI